MSLAVLLAAGSATVLAGETTPFHNPKAEAVFAKQFAGAENVKWASVDADHVKVAFTLGGTRAEAYFSAAGELLGTVRNLFYNQLPLLVMQSVSNRFGEPVIIEVKEITNTEGTSYRVILEHKEKKYNVRLNSLGEIIESEKVKK